MATSLKPAIQIVMGEALEFVVHEATIIPDKYEVFRVVGDTVTEVIGVSNNPRNMQSIAVSTVGGTVDNLFAPDGAVVGSAITDLYEVAAPFTYGDKGLIVVYQVGDTQADVIPFQVVRGVGIEKLTDVQTADNDTPMLAAPNTILGRLWTVEKNQRDVLMPRQRRMLGLLGEHQVVDAFLYDDDGNITECRLRNFDDKTNAAAAGKWTDRLNQADPRTSPTGDPGEVGVYTITANNLLPRNLRTLFEQKIDADPADNLFGTGTGDGTTGSTV